jgi:hypothetical protein
MKSQNLLKTVSIILLSFFLGLCLDAQESGGDQVGYTDVYEHAITKWTSVLSDPPKIGKSNMYYDDKLIVNYFGQENNSTEVLLARGAIGLNSTLDFKTDLSYIMWGDGTSPGSLSFASKGGKHGYHPIMRIDGENGFVGIGTTTPDFDLEISRDDQPTLSLTNNNGGFLMGLSSEIGAFTPESQPQDIVFITEDINNHHGMIFNINNNFNNGSGYIKFTDNYNGTVLGIFNNGRIGIRTNEPQAIIDIADVFEPGEMLLKVGNDAFFTDIDNENTIGLFGIPDPQVAKLKLGSEGPILYGEEGYLGIGTVNPLATLHVNGNVVIGENLQTPAGYMLYVDDGILTERVKVAVVGTEDWSDHVFEPEYQLMSLAEIEHFIHQNKHLPGIPSADKVVEEGVDLLEMNAMLLEKIEELTLHIIKQQKILDKQQSEIDVLKSNQK